MSENMSTLTCDIELNEVIDNLEADILFIQEQKSKLKTQIAEHEHSIWIFKLAIAAKQEEIDFEKEFMIRRLKQDKIASDITKSNELKKRCFGYIQEIQSEIEPLRMKIAKIGEQVTIRQNKITEFNFKLSNKSSEIRDLGYSIYINDLEEYSIYKEEKLERGILKRAGY